MQVYYGAFAAYSGVESSIEVKIDRLFFKDRRISATRTEALFTKTR